jgi:hypothetical protein
MKKILFLAGVVSIVAVSCNKDAATSTSIAAASPTGANKTIVTPVDQPTPNFSITFDGEGGYSTSDVKYVNSFAQLKNAVVSMAESIQGSQVTVLVNDQGEVSSLDNKYDGLQFMTMMTVFGNFYFAGTQDLKVVYSKDGFKSISNPDLLLIFPSFEQKLKENGEIMKAKIDGGKDVVISFNANNELLIDGVLANTNSEDLYEFQQCLRYYWWMPATFAYPVCAIALYDR